MLTRHPVLTPLLVPVRPRPAKCNLLARTPFSFWPRGFWDLSSPVRVQTQALGSESTVPNHWSQGIASPIFPMLELAYIMCQ